MYWQQKSAQAAPEPSSHAYRLKLWPAIPDEFRTARVLRACSRMSVGPVTVNWFLEATGLDAAEAAELVANLESQGAIERIELGPRAPAPAAAAGAAAPAAADPAGRTFHRLPWRHAAAAVAVCGLVSAVLDPALRAEFALLALRDLPALWG